ncbi:MAG: serine/threonine protein kinase [Clostridia bacterium]|nr:serine/threonine protein kinase [Clostridia bacterium]
MIPDIIDGKYEVLQEIGSGGMAHVYKAISIGSRKVVAVKMLKEEYLNDQEFLRRFEREARASLALSHDNIVRAFGVGTHDNIPYIVLEYVEGKTLKELIHSSPRGHLSVQQSISICSQVLDALSYAHAHGIVHRDVKPQNVIVTARGRAKLADFGIAREMTTTTVTFSGKNVIGSVQYISPEQAQGLPATAESDIYSAGVSLYEMLTGSVPFNGDTTVATALMHISNQPKPPKELNPQIPPALNDIVLRAMEKDPAMRYASAKLMRGDLIRALSHPNGTFARDRTSREQKAPGRRMSLSVYAWISISVFTPILVIFVAYLGFVNQWCAGSEPDVTQAAASPVTENVVYAAVEAVQPTPSSGTAPTVTGFRLDDALRVLHVAGYENIYVSMAYATDSSRTGTIVAQRYSADDSDKQAPVYLTLLLESHGKYKADVSFLLDIEEADSTVQMVYRTSNTENIDYSVILYETVRTKESMVSISATVYSNDPATRTLYLLVNGEEVRSQDAKFSE